jgi:hypothetical protein
MLEKTDMSGIYKDRKSGAIVNKDINKLNAYRKQKTIIQNSRIASENFNVLKTEISEMKIEISEMKTLLKKIKTLIKMEET